MANPEDSRPLRLSPMPAASLSVRKTRQKVAFSHEGAIMDVVASPAFKAAIYDELVQLFGSRILSRVGPHSRGSSGSYASLIYSTDAFQATTKALLAEARKKCLDRPPLLTECRAAIREEVRRLLDAGDVTLAASPTTTDCSTESKMLTDVSRLGMTTSKNSTDVTLPASSAVTDVGSSTEHSSSLATNVGSFTHIYNTVGGHQRPRALGGSWRAPRYTGRSPRPASLKSIFHHPVPDQSDTDHEAWNDILGTVTEYSQFSDTPSALAQFTLAYDTHKAVPVYPLLSKDVKEESAPGHVDFEEDTDEDGSIVHHVRKGWEVVLPFYGRVKLGGVVRKMWPARS